MSTFNDINVYGDFYGITQTKGDIISNDGIKNNRLPIGTDTYILAADSTQAMGLKWIDPKLNYIIYSQISLTQPITSNVPFAIPIVEFNSTPTAGNYVVFYDLTYALSNVISRTASIGIYKNGSLMTGSEKVVDSGAIAVKNNYSFQFSCVFNGTDTFSIKFYVSDNDTTISISDGHLFMLQVSD